MDALQLYKPGGFTVPTDNVRGQKPDTADPVFAKYKKDVLRMVEDAGRAYTLEEFHRIAQLINYDRITSYNVCYTKLLRAGIGEAAPQLGQSSQARPATVRSVIAPTILTPAEAATVNLPFQVSFELPEGVSATDYVLEIAYFHPQQNKCMYVGLLGGPFSGQSLAVNAQQLARNNFV